MRILIVRLSAIGDVVMATPVARALRQAYPEAHITWLVERLSADVVRGNPYLDEVLVWDRGRSRSWVGGFAGVLSQARWLRRTLRQRRFDLALDLQGLMRSALPAWLSGAPIRVGYAGAREMASRLYTHTVPNDLTRSTQQRQLDLLTALGIESQDTRMTVTVPEEAQAFADAFLAEQGLDPGRTVALVPYASMEWKQWPEEHWAALAETLGRSHGLRGLVLGGPADVPAARRLAARASPPLAVAAGKTTLKQAAALLRSCRAAVSVDTGLLHFAVALERPTVGLFAPTWLRLASQPHFRMLTQEVPCPPDTDVRARWAKCLQAISPEDVLEALLPLLELEGLASEPGQDSRRSS